MEVEFGRRVGKEIERIRPEVVLSGNTPTETQHGIVKATKAIDSRFFYWVQDFYSIAVAKFAKKKLPIVGHMVGGYYTHLDRKHFQMSDGIVVITDDFRPILENDFGVPGEKIHFHPNWSPIERLPLQSADNDWSREKDLHDSFVFLYSGTLGMKHNPDLLLQLALQHRDDEGVKVVVTSEGLGAEWLKEKCEEHGLKNLLLLPYQDFAQVPNMLAAGNVLIGVLEPDAGVFSVPSKVLTYLCAKRAILLAVPGVNLAAQIIKDEEAGLTVEPDDTAGFLQAAARLRENEAECKRFGQNGRAYAEENFDLEKIGARFEKILEA